MCGIAGFCNFTNDWKENIQRMNDKMYHRGPDAFGIWRSEDGSVVFGHRRLSIVDLSETGAQPMMSHNGRYAIAYNGEIYNYAEIRKRLETEKKVTAFHGSSDTEVLLESICAYGMDETLQRIKGMFAFAIYDTQEKTLVLARDRVGEKPLYYGFINNNCFVFASDLNSIAAIDGFDNPVNPEVLPDYFRYGYIPAPHSIYKNIWKLEPGKTLKIKYPFNKYETSTYWSMMDAARSGEKNPFKGSPEEATDELERLLRNSIADQMVADVPVGAFLSAGIDSSTIVSLMQTLSSQKVRSFTIGMWDKEYNEADVAAQIAAHIGTEHTELYITEEDAKGVIPLLSGMFGEPFADSSQIPTYLVSRMTKEHVTVSLSGDGGDELFCGYDTYASIDRIWNKTRKIPGIVRTPASVLLQNTLGRKSADMKIRANLLGAKTIEDMYLRSEIGEGISLVRKERLEKSGKRDCIMDIYPKGYLKEPKHNLMLMDMLMYHPDDILCKVDRTAMAVSLETRVPMLDRDVVEFAWSLPISYCSENGVRKKILKEVLYRYVPKELVDRPKTGFRIPLAKWLKEPALRTWAEELLDPGTIARQGLLDEKMVWKLWEDYIQRGIWRMQIWYVLMFQQWMRDRGL